MSTPETPAPMSTPDITAAQIGSILFFAVTEAVSNGFISNGTGQLITDIAGAVIPTIWLFVDAHIRRGRAAVVAARLAAAAAAAVATVPPPRKRAPAKKKPAAAAPAAAPAAVVPVPPPA